jgi:hypothetical protein
MKEFLVEFELCWLGKWRKESKVMTGYTAEDLMKQIRWAYGSTSVDELTVTELEKI